MINIDARLKTLRAEFAVAERGGDDRLSSELSFRIDEVLRFRAPEPEGTDFCRKMIVEIEENLESGTYTWSATVRLPNGEVLAGSLSDDMPCSPGSALQSAGRVLDIELANDHWASLFSMPVEK